MNKKLKKTIVIILLLATIAMYACACLMPM